ncbi:RlmE family RNA methyltransferase [Limnobacter sp.]|uniref:RlmE family RNA methyltransferase n=1 Tax=Limnobacter sp. TaxID=2003368 RepID=UPI0025884905|nr:RlmE family RNA methyltransferase [Limnobacter sp.]HEX5484551.1 RlmE family RNA methyltransferase [Limnobacter sp.]
MAKKKKLNKNWLHDHINDPYVKMANQAGYRARAAYKLKEIAEPEGLIRPGIKVVDLGSAPGSWSQVLRDAMVGPEGVIQGRIIALDILPMEPIAGVEFIQGDFREDSVLAELQKRLEGSKLDMVVSDMAPNLSGVASADAARMEHVCELAIDFAVNHLKPNGVLIMKMFHGSSYSNVIHTAKQVFKTVAPRKPKASRDRSRETFMLAKGLK